MSDQVATNPPIGAVHLEAPHGLVASSPDLKRTVSEGSVAMDGTDYREILPKPSNDPNDPLNWSWAQKHVVLLLVALMAFQGPFDAASPASGFLEQAPVYHTSVPSMLDSVGAHAVMAGAGGLLWVPLSYRYGRSPIYTAGAVVATLGALGCALANDLPAFCGARVVNGLGCSASMSIGALTVKDLFFIHERGQKIGIWTISIGLSPYIATLLDGFVTTHAGWRWMQWLTFIIWSVLLVLCVVALPETLYDRHHGLLDVPPKKTYVQRLKWKHFKGRQLTFRNFWHPCTMFFYPSVIFPGFYYGNLYGFCVFGALGMLPFAFAEIYGFDAIGQGLVAIPLAVGTILGEPLAGPFSDWMVRFLAQRNDGLRHPEQRLQAYWLGAILVPLGLTMFGLTLQYEVHWIAPCIAIAIYSFAIQIVSTVTFTYAVDCYEHVAGEVALVLNFCRMEFAFYVSFYLPHYTKKVGYGWAFGIYAILSVMLFLPMILLMFKGGQIRKRLGTPQSDFVHHAVPVQVEESVPGTGKEVE
ncbi:uncharacterized protein Z518_06467 [Rhinocladiella mackenziei CBS 650.93]|uniref:Major facilitator superfamily (MFS) profile domain-containing protein n=1 Tax=Rhinocladiella mackenziei CBS 650.93 TaxID=1442369 RepID=A0A0D2J904_9EURO|nr:uncharacterized protein Z518_06467 [Rhinocladiella mackenziei CBS 650.93]KIX05595.1 hypothetical protein Z518_06467 [Rhinocladiella mackenziei CBS 650.93]